MVAKILLCSLYSTFLCIYSIIEVLGFFIWIVLNLPGLRKESPRTNCAHFCKKMNFLTKVCSIVRTQCAPTLLTRPSFFWLLQLYQSRHSRLAIRPLFHSLPEFFRIIWRNKRILWYFTPAAALILFFFVFLPLSWNISKYISNSFQLPCFFEWKPLFSCIFSVLHLHFCPYAYLTWRSFIFFFAISTYGLIRNGPNRLRIRKIGRVLVFCMNFWCCVHAWFLFFTR